MLNTLFEFLNTQPLLLRVFLIGAIPALLTILGSTPVLLRIRFTEPIIDSGMGFAAGIMLVASFTSLLLPSIELGSISISIIGFVLGVLLIRLLDSIIPHLHFVRRSNNVKANTLYKAWLMALAMIIHNIPEGMAVGVGATYSVMDGLTIALAIGIQDIPEGLAVALPILSITKSRRISFAIGALSGLAEAFAALIPAVLVAYAHIALPLMLALASGSMVYVVVHEIIPEIYGHERNEPSTIGFFIGFIVMLLLDSLLG